MGNQQGQGQGSQRADLTLEQVSELLRGQLGDEVFRNGGIRTALMKDGAPIGKHGAVLAYASGLHGAGGVVSVEHKLERVPGYARILQVIPPAGASPCPHISVSPKEYEKWTDTTLRVDLYVVGPGSMDGTIVVLEVGGERVA